MISVQFILFLGAFCVGSSDWVSEWMSPVQDQFPMSPARRSDGIGFKPFADETLRVDELNPDSHEIKTQPTKDSTIFRQNVDDQSTSNLNTKLRNTLQSAQLLVNKLKTQIDAVSDIEILLKDAIVNGRSGVTMLTVTSVEQIPRSYIIRDGYWTACNGMIQMPDLAPSTNLFTGLFSTPRCIGKEIPSRRDPCAFNSVIKYEVVPSHRRLEYIEEDYLCLKTNFNSTMEHYLSVTKQLINETCKNGIIRSFAEHAQHCSVRTISEYSYYPHRSSSAAALPLEYCTEKDNSCKLIVAWHVSNSTMENFEFLKNEKGFKKYFLKNGPYIEHIM